jgi:MFS family permease
MAPLDRLVLRYPLRSLPKPVYGWMTDRTGVRAFLTSRLAVFAASLDELALSPALSSAFVAALAGVLRAAQAPAA